MTHSSHPASARDKASGLRRWTDIILAMSLAIMVTSGLGLFAWHDAPQAQAATGSFLGLHYEIWSHVHIVASALFTGAAVSHLRLNARLLLRHFVRNAG